MKICKVAVVGLGNISIRHRRNLKSLFPNVELLAMSASGRIPKEEISYSDSVVTSIDALIEANVEFVIVASPAPFHAQHSIPLIEAGIPTLIEKPVTTTIEDANAIQKAIDKYGTPVAVGYCLRYLPSTIKMKALLDSNAIGILYNANIEIGQYLPDWRPNRDYRDCVSSNKILGGGALFELSHELDYAQWLLGELELQYAILRSSKELNLQVEDMVDLLTLTESGAVANIHLDFLQRKAYRKCSFVGSEGRIEWDLINNQLTLTTRSGTNIIYNDPEWDKNQMYLAMVNDFIQMIEQQPHNCVTVSDASLTVDFISRIRQKFVNSRDII
ncbi:Gfo/Idh/MocA family protein [Vibrio bathopelagicus]